MQQSCCAACLVAFSLYSIHAMQCFEADKVCTGWLSPVFSFEPTAVQACTDFMHTADVWGVHLILDDARRHCAGDLIDIIKQ